MHHFPVSFYSVSPSLLTFHLITLCASGCSVDFHIFVLCVSFPLFLSLCLVCPWGNLSTTMLSVTALPHYLLPSFSSLLRLCLCALSLYRLLTLLPSMSPCLSCSYFQSQAMHTYAHTRLKKIMHLLSWAVLFLSEKHAASLLFLSSFILLTFSSILPPHLFHLLIFPCLHFSPLPLPHYSTLHLPLPLSFISIREQISFATGAGLYWSFLTHTHTHTQVECNRSVCLVIDLTRLDG